MVLLNRIKTIVSLALPIIAGLVSQNIMVVIDMAMVGTLGTDALAAVGIASQINFMSFALLIGLASGVLAISARMQGKGNNSETAVPLNGALLISCVVGIPLSGLLYYTAPFFFPTLHSDPNVIALGNDYLQVRVLSITAVAMTLSFRGYWSGIKRPKLFMNTLLLMLVCNVALNYLLIFGNLGFPKMGVTGAGVATSLSLFIGAVYCFYLGFKYSATSGFLQRLPTKTQLRTLITISLPQGAQQLFRATGLTVMFIIIGSIGTDELAVANVLVNITLVMIIPCIGFGLAAASLVGQALGESAPEQAKRWGWDTSLIGLLFMCSISLPMVLFPELILSIFVHEQALIDMAKLPLQLISLLLAFDAVGVILLNSLLGAGASKQVLKITFSIQWLVFLPAAWIVSHYLGMGLLAIWCLNIAYRAIQAGIFVKIWHQGRWSTIEI
ncbi:MATE family efflux transporter [Pseudoalteromonas sp. JBTF-M23]|uniref:Multidrug-efflux transporter n=1 Tax=Pseudoalteromonas caenipelagi TaxID=2726988 RepID=A0A849VFI5_9GAMM|nr:MATE family efflux transporter [Pseudoalteromonas caenipelagi]NOU51273.1 MATE family efflux transporter [Pseudoalteromonas caenipelagi]